MEYNYGRELVQDGPDRMYQTALLERMEVLIEKVADVASELTYLSEILEKREHQ